MKPEIEAVFAQRGLTDSQFRTLMVLANHSVDNQINVTVERFAQDREVGVDEVALLVMTVVSAGRCGNIITGKVLPTTRGPKVMALRGKFDARCG